MHVKLQAGHGCLMVPYGDGMEEDLGVPGGHGLRDEATKLPQNLGADYEI